MQKPLKSRALRNHKPNLPVKKKAAGGIFRRPILFLVTLFWPGFPSRANIGLRFNSGAPVAQRIEHLPSKQRAAGSSPAGGTIPIPLDSKLLVIVSR